MEKLYVLLLLLGNQFASVISEFVENRDPKYDCPRVPVKCFDQYQTRCRDEKYRSTDGSCNHPYNRGLGKSYTAYRRILPAAYSDGVHAIRLARSGNDLPSPRAISHKAFGRKTIDDPKLTLLTMEWGQMITEDQSLHLASGFVGLKPVDPQVGKCCTIFGRYEIRNDSTRCIAIPVSWNDPFFRNRECIDFDRTVTDKDQKCPGTGDRIPEQQLNGATHFLDLSFIYGSRDEDNLGVRAFSGGLLLTNDDEGLWPVHADNVPARCPLGELNGICYLFGDPRGNQNPGIASLHITLLREHNRLARALAKINPHWDDEKLYQEARMINIAQYQHITFYEFALKLFGAERLHEYGIIYDVPSNEYVNNYDPCVDPRSLQSFQHAAFRFLHNTVKGYFNLVTESREFLNESLRISEFLQRPGTLETKCQFDSVLRGLATQLSAMSDTNFDFEISDNYMELGIAIGFRGHDLRSYDIQRDRDHGLPSYNDFREYCGLRRANSWSDYSDLISEEDIYKMRKIYEHFDDVDLSVGGAYERKEQDSVFGQTFLCIAMHHFLGSRKGDRYFFENGDQPHPLKPDQLAEIRKATAARLLCHNSGISSIQPDAFIPASERNPLTNCSHLPYVDLRKWKERTCVCRYDEF